MTRVPRLRSIARIAWARLIADQRAVKTGCRAISAINSQMSVEKSNVMGVAFQRTAFNGVTCSTASVPPVSICCVLIENNALRRTCRIGLEAVEADFELAWRKPPLELRAVHFCRTRV